MPGEPYSAERLYDDAPWDEMEGSLDQLAALVRQSVPAEQFRSELVARAVRGLAAEGGALWILDRDGHVQSLHQVNMPPGLAAENHGVRLPHDRLIRHVIQHGQPAVVAPGASPANDQDAVNATDHLLLLCPIRWEPVGGLIEVFQRPDAPPEARHGYLRFLAALAELAVDYQTRWQLGQLRLREAGWRRLTDFGQRLHRGLDVRRTAYTLVNDGRPLTGADRLSLALPDRGRYRLEAVSGLDTLDRRSNQVVRLEQLASAVATVDEPLWYNGDAGSLPPELAERVEAYLDQSHARVLAVLPLRVAEDDEPGGATESGVGVLIAERFEAGHFDDDFQHGLSEVCGLAASALHNAVEYERVPLRPVWRWLAGIAWLAQARQLPKTVTAAAAAAIVLIGLMVIPADLTVTGNGQLQPRLRRDVFAESDGVVSEVLCRHGDTVREGDVLVTLRDAELDLVAARIDGELQTARTQLATVRATRIGMNPSGAEEFARYNQLVADEEELRAGLTGLEAQQQVLQDRRAALAVRSPISANVVTWDVDQRLRARPVQRGDVLMRVAYVDGPWELLIEVPDRHIGHVLTGRRASEEELPVSFVLATDPETRYTGTVQHVSMATQFDAAGQPTVEVRVRIERDAIPLVRPGASVIAKIDCGRRSIGYVWFHDLIAQVRSHLWF